MELSENRQYSCQPIDLKNLGMATPTSTFDVYEGPARKRERTRDNPDKFREKNGKRWR